MDLLELARSVKFAAAPPKEPPSLDGLTIAAFTASGRVLRLYSDVLNEEVLIAADDADLNPNERRVVYRASELPELLGISPEGLRLVHEVKTVFEGSALVALGSLDLD